MAAPTIYRSTDASAPTLSGTAGELVALLDACLVNGYGSQTAAGWTKPYTSTNSAVFLQGGATPNLYWQVDDNAAGTGVGRDALCYGFETMSAYNTGTGRFPTTAQVATVGAVVRKSATADATTRVWMVIADDRTCYVWVLTNDSAGVYMGYCFGDFYSYVPSDDYKCSIQGGSVSQTGARTSDAFGTLTYGFVTAQSDPNCYVPRNYTALGGSTAIVKIGDGSMIPISSTADQNAVGNLFFPNMADGGLYIAPVRIADGSTPGTTVAGSIDIRGHMRGLWQVCHATANFADGDTFIGNTDAGPFSCSLAGREFMFVKPLMGPSTAGVYVVETTEWDTSP